MTGLSFDETKRALDRFRGEVVSIHSPDSAPGAHLPRSTPENIVLREIEFGFDTREVGLTDAERYVRPREKRRYIEFGDGEQPSWRISEEDFLGGSWLAVDRQLTILSDIGAVILRSNRPLPQGPHVYVARRLEANDFAHPSTEYRSERRLLRGDRINIEGQFWSVDRIDDEDDPCPAAILRRSISG